MNRSEANAASRHSADSGASIAKRSIGDRWSSYLAHHRSSFHSTLQRLFLDKGQTVMTALVVAIALALPALLFVSLNNLKQLGEQWDADPKLTLYIHERAQSSAIALFQAELEKDSRVASHRFISADQALAEFQRFSGFGSVLDGLESNPLPAAIEIHLDPEFQEPKTQQALATEWQQLAIVDQVSVDLKWVQRFLAITDVLTTVVSFLAALLALGALLAIGNTVRLIIENRKEEIIVIKLVGGTNGFVRRPLLYTGGLYGFFGAFIAIVLVQLVLLVISPSVDALAESYHSDFEIAGLGGLASLQVLLFGTFVGWLGAVFAVGRHLSEIEPT